MTLNRKLIVAHDHTYNNGEKFPLTSLSSGTETNGKIPVADGDGGITWTSIDVPTIVEGPGIDVVDGSTIGLGLDSILLVHNDGTPASEYATISDACAASVSGDMILIAKVGIITENSTIPARVSLSGLGEGSVIAGDVTLNNGSTLSNLTVDGDINLPSSGSAILGSNLYITGTVNGQQTNTDYIIDFDGGDDPTYTVIYGTVDSGGYSGNCLNGAEIFASSLWSMLGTIRIPISGYLASLSFRFRFNNGFSGQNFHITARIEDESNNTIYTIYDSDTVAYTEDTWHQVNFSITPPKQGSYIYILVGNSSGVGDPPNPGWYNRIDDIAYTVASSLGGTGTSVGTHFSAEPNNIEPGWSAQSAWDISGFPKRHAKDINDETWTYHKNPASPVDPHGHTGDDDGGYIPFSSSAEVRLNYQSGPFLTEITANGYAANYTNSLQIRYDAIASCRLGNDEYQVVSFWNNTGKLVIGLRQIPEFFILYTYTGIAVTDSDAHRGISLGLDKDGYVHVSYDHGPSGTTALNYRRSTNPVNNWDGTLTDPLSMTGTAESGIMYPIFVNDASGSLYFFKISSADIYFLEYSTVTKTWAGASGTETNGILIDGDSAGKWPYLFQPWFDANDNLHLFYMWTTSDLNTRESICYVYWNGTTYKKADGTSQTVPITYANAEVIDAIGPGAISQHTGVMSDSYGRPHAVYAYYPTLSGRESIRHIFWNGSSWTTKTWTNQTLDSTTVGIYPRLLIDDHNIAYILYVNPDATSDGIKMLTSNANDYATWTPNTLYEMNVYTYMPKFDSYQWRHNQRLYLSVEPYTNGQSALPIYLLEFNPSGWALYDAVGNPDLHTNDIDSVNGIHHTLGTGANQAATGNHIHDDRYYTQSEVDALIAAIPTANAGEILMADGEAVATPLSNENDDDWLYEG